MAPSVSSGGASVPPSTRDGTTFLLDAGSGAFKGSFGIPTSAASKPPSVDVTDASSDVYDCIVVGAGFAGLTALRELAWRGVKSILVVEARDRIGGRTFTAELPWGGDQGTTKVEMGGTWVHVSQPHVFAELTRYGLRNSLVASESLFKPGATSLTFVEPGDTHTTFSRVEYDPSYDEALVAFFDVDGFLGRKDIPQPFTLSTSDLNAEGLAKWDALSVGDRVEQLLKAGKINGKQADYVLAYMSSLALQPDPKKMGFVEAWRWFSLPGHTVEGLVEAGGVWKLKHGTTNLLGHILDDALSAGAKIDFVFDRVVDSVTEADGVVTLSTTLNPLATPTPSNPAEAVAFKARSTIITIPHNVLHKVSFSPPLSTAKAAAIGEPHTGEGYKVIAHSTAASGIPPSASGFAAGFGDNAPVFHMSMGDKRTGDGGALLVGFGCARGIVDSLPSVYRPELEAKHDPERIMDGLFKSFPDLSVFGTSDSQPVSAYTFHNWTHDPYSMGTWSFHGPEFWSSGHDIALRAKHGNGMFFANGDYSEGWKGFIDGAIETGLVVGRDVASFLRKLH
ncbi:hypothetical protein DFJ74DRAFT_695315 [Hyaloraphidium curvatum]|nr:hypothetical protein DFJ74DRAFT_695315 [Hyaloraphidium curvatum]